MGQGIHTVWGDSQSKNSVAVFPVMLHKGSSGGAMPGQDHEAVMVLAYSNFILGAQHALTGFATDFGGSDLDLRALEGMQG